MEKDEEAIELDLSKGLKEKRNSNSSPRDSRGKSPLKQTTVAAAPSARLDLSYSLSSDHLRLWENSFAASAISAAAMSHFMDLSRASNAANRKANNPVDRVDSARDKSLFDWSKVARESIRFNFDENLVDDRISDFLSAAQKNPSGNEEEVLDLKMGTSSKKLKKDHEGNASKDSRTNSDNNGKSYPCSDCHKTFATEVDLKAHLMRHVTQHPYVCLACGKGFKYDHTLDFHIKSQHGVDGNANVNLKNLGKKLFRSKKDLSSDSKSRNASDNDIDSIGDENTFEDANNNRTSNSLANTSVDFGFPTNFAPRSIQIKSEKVLVTMLEGVHPLSEQTYILYKCCLCGYAFPSLEPVVVHVQTVHSNHSSFTCDKCGATFKWRSELQLHDQLHKAMDQQSKSKQFLMPSFLQPNLVLMNPYFGDNMSAVGNPSTTRTDDAENQGLNLSLNSKIEKPAVENDVQIPLERKNSVEVKQEKPVRDDSSSLIHCPPFQPQLPKPVGDIEETAPGQFKCRFCDKTFDRIFSVHRHERVHTGYKPCICKVCGRGFSEKRNLRHHIIRFHSDGSGRELLKRVRKEKSLSAASFLKKAAVKFLSNSLSESNENVQNKRNVISQPCAMNEEDNKRDLDTSAGKQQDDEAKAADKSSSSRRKKSKPSKKIINTEDCSPSSPKEVKIKEEHFDVDEKESEQSPPAVESKDTSGSESDSKLHCHGAFFSSYNPRLGIVEKPIKRSFRPLIGPDGKYIYPCGYCQKTFCSLSDLNRHMNFHEDVRPFKCEYCDYQSRTNSQLKVHMLRHAGIKQYLCQICNYNGVTQSDLNRHCKTRSHILRSANVCPLCSLGFSTRTLLEDHVLKFHETTSLEILNKEELLRKDADNESKEFTVNNLL
ncbi:zinc finger protein 236-like protein [Dinothrombium tinctorium]|uniref:Zinc finger protein 236-like protein n=1 Tax=Dinothrombium tinctorium TaxID=1965070 RepID=A0A3S3PWF1_9ACAR|nr:zinc finger protein 236-like protein [Dinothrombium tinctorium]RWS17628.1 zinc finger protein 236-like protein [Dinothrombium tinctorium]